VFHLFASNGQDQGTVHSQRYNGRSTRGRQANHGSALPSKMIGPTLASRMEERHPATSRRINRRPASFLAQRTGYAGESQIVRGGRAAAASWNDMVDVECSFLALLCQATILATIVRPRHDQSTQACRYRAHRPAALACSTRSRSNDNISAKFTSPSASSLSAAERDWSRSWRSSNSCKRAFTPAGR